MRPRQPRRSTQEHPPDLPTLMPPPPFDLERPLDVPDEAGMQVALHRALRHHLLRIRETEGIDYTEYRGEMEIIPLPRAHPVEVSPGWWAIGSVCDAHSGISWQMTVHWQPSTDRVRIDPIPPIPPPPPIPACRPLSTDGNGRVRVDDGWRYWYQGKAYTAEEARQILSVRRASTDGWSWVRIGS